MDTPAASLEACAGLCARDEGAALAGIGYDSVAQMCSCFDESPLQDMVDRSATVLIDAANVLLPETPLRYYSATLCKHTLPDHDEHAFVWDRAAAAWCPGVVQETGAGLVPTSGVLHSPAQSVDYALECRKGCDDDAECSFAEVLVTPWDELAGAKLQLPRPPPAPPPPPPSPPPPLDPRPPGVPDTNELYREWHPSGAEIPTDSDGDGRFEITCGMSSCGGGYPVFQGSLDAALELVREMQVSGTWHQTLCPFECEPVLHKHALSPAEHTSFKSGTGFAGLTFPGAEAADRGFDEWRAVDVPGATHLEAKEVVLNSTQTACETLVLARGVVGSQLAVWQFTHRVGSSSFGRCLTFHAVRSPQQRVLWSSFARHASATTNLPYFATPSTAARVPDDSEPCGTTSRTCVMWLEFDGSDGGSDIYRCRPNMDLTGVLLPVRIAKRAIEAGVAFPPPSSPPPATLSPPPPSPPPMVCSAANIPTVADGTTTTDDFGNAYESNGLVALGAYCWKWSFADREEDFHSTQTRTGMGGCAYTHTRPIHVLLINVALSTGCTSGLRSMHGVAS
jgi:hypothetical protein